MEQFDSVLGVVKAGLGLRKGRNISSLDWPLIDVKHERIGEVANQVSKSLGYPFNCLFGGISKFPLLSTYTPVHTNPHPK